MVIAARPTLYKGIQMRSRLEALYAAYLDNFRPNPDDLPCEPWTPWYRWCYEPMAFGSPEGQYLPDFYVTCAPPNPELPMQRTAWEDVEAGLVSSGKFVEVKPINADFRAALDRMHVIRATFPEVDLEVVANLGTYDDPDFWPVFVCGYHRGCGVPCRANLHPDWLGLRAAARAVNEEL